MDISDDMGVRKLSVKVFLKLNYSFNVFCCCCFPGLSRVSHHLSDNKAGQHASVLHRSRAEVIVSTLHFYTHSFFLTLVAQRKCELSHVPTSYP